MINKFNRYRSLTFYGVASLLHIRDPTLILGTDAVKAADVVRVLGVNTGPRT